MARHLVDSTQLSTGDLEWILANAAQLKGLPQTKSRDMRDRIVALLFDQPSLRTRVSFEAAVLHLGGHALNLLPAEVGLGRREEVEDVARVLSGYVDAVVLRSIHQELIDRFALASTVPVINAMSDLWHPCQGMTDIFTIRELLPGVQRPTVAYIGEAGAVANSLMFTAAHAGMRIRLATPEQLRPRAELVDAARQVAAVTGGAIDVLVDAQAAAENADVLYTDSWRGVGQELDADRRRALLRSYRVDTQMLARAATAAIVLHDLPAYRGDEIAADVLDGPQSRVLTQAANRVPVQEAILLWLFEDTAAGSAAERNTVPL
jgi:ornithine carbamoyltransferase